MQCNALSDYPSGLLSPLTPLQPLLNPPTTRTQAHRHFSAFPLTSHLHTPYLRLVSLYPHLVFPVSFLRVPGIPDGFSWTVFLARNTIAEDALAVASDELGLTKVLGGPGGGNVEYVLEEVWKDKEVEGMMPTFVSDFPCFTPV